MNPADFITEDGTGRRLILTDRKKIAENVLYLSGEPISLDDYRPLHAVYQTSAQNIVICAGRQISKSTTLGNFMIADGIGTPHWEQVGVLPSVMQMRRFSSDKVGKVIRNSPLVRKWFIDHTCERALYKRSFLNGSAMHFGAMTQLESLRGLSANRILEDEIQDMNGDDLEIIEQALSGKKSGLKFIMRTGTAKTVGNVLESTLRESTMNEWIVVCPAGHHNIPSADNIGEKGFICKKCRSLCDVRGGYWRSMAGLDQPWMGFRIPQIILPLHTEDAKNWSDLVYKRNHINPVTFNNEVMGQAAGSGITILSEDDLTACCQPEFEIDEQYSIGKDPDIAFVWGTCDWGLMAIKSFTIATIWGVTRGGQLKMLYSYRFIDPDPYEQVAVIARLFQNMGVSAIGCDWGMGMVQSRMLEETLKIPVMRFMYVGEQRALMVWDQVAKIWKVNRTQAMTETFVWMKRKRFWLPKWSWFKPMFSQDVLCIYEEAVNQKTFKNDSIRYDHPRDKADDWAHTAVYSLLLFYLASDRGKSEYLVS